MFGRRISIQGQLILTSILVLVLVVALIASKVRSEWRWAGVSSKNVLGALAAVIFGAVFLYAATPLFPPTNPAALPWYLAGGGIVAFGVLSSLRFVDLAKRNEGSTLEDDTVPRAKSPPWQKAIRTAYFVVFLLVWLASVGFFYSFGISYKAGSPTPTATQAEPLENHGQTVFVTKEEKKRVDLLSYAMSIGIPAVLLGGAFLHFIVGVALFPNTPSFWEALRKRAR
jgi:hypothetical protein